jgi:hypothetical protein
MPYLRSFFSALLGGMAILGWFTFLLVVAGGVLLYFTSGPYSRTPTPADIALLGSDVHVSIGGVPLVLPLIALADQSRLNAFLSGYSAEKFERQAKERATFAASAVDPTAPRPMEKAGLRIESFGLEDVDGKAWRTICDGLLRDWSRSVCDDSFAPLLQALPRGRFDLADARHLDAFRDTYLAIGDLGEAAPVLQTMDLSLGEPALACGKPHKPDAARPCLTALRIRGDLIAVWFVSDGPKEPALTQARREGQAITALVLHGLGPVEDFDRLGAAACATLRPGAGPPRPDAPSWTC